MKGRQENQRSTRQWLWGKVFVYPIAEYARLYPDVILDIEFGR